MGRAAAVRSPAQSQAIWALAAQLQRLGGLSKDDVEGLVRRAAREASGQERTSLLSGVQAVRVIQALQAEVDRYGAAARPEAAPEKREHEPWGAREPVRREKGTITPYQQWLIGQLFALVGWTELERQRAFILRQTKRPWPQTQADADAIVEPLKAIALREVDPREIQARAKALVGHAKLNAWQRGFIADLVGQFEGASDPRKVLSARKLEKLLEAESHCGVSR